MDRGFRENEKARLSKAGVREKRFVYAESSGKILRAKRTPVFVRGTPPPAVVAIKNHTETAQSKLLRLSPVNKFFAPAAKSAAADVLPPQKNAPADRSAGTPLI